MREVITLSHRELERVTILQQCLERHITQVQAAKWMRLSYRHTKCLSKSLREGALRANTLRGPLLPHLKTSYLDLVIGTIRSSSRDVWMVGAKTPFKSLGF